MLSYPALLLRFEEACLLVGVLLLYAHLHFSWPLFGLLFFVPDISMLGYCINPRVGSALYNLGHVLAFPLVLLAIAYGIGWPQLIAIALIWFSHIAFDRLLGYGLKYPTYFRDTHLHRLN